METFIGDIVKISVETKADLTGRTIELLYRKPDGTEGIWNGTMSNTSNTVAYYTTQVSDLNVAGLWKLQAFVYTATTKAHGKLCQFYVREHLPDSQEEQ